MCTRYNVRKLRRLPVAGSRTGTKTGSRSWAGQMSNLLNVGATRAKRVLYIVGNRKEWENAGVFSEAARLLERGSVQRWLPAAQLALTP